MIVVHPQLPLADGIAFDDADLFLSHQLTMLVARGLVWTTEFEANGRNFTGSVLAGSEEQAAAIADARGLSERVLGRRVVTGAAPRLPFEGGGD